MKTSFCKANPTYWACVAQCQRKFSSAREFAHQHILSRGNHVPSVLRVGEQSESLDLNSPLKGIVQLPMMSADQGSMLQDSVAQEV